jgi:SAM-dependent methyltransferase
MGPSPDAETEREYVGNELELFRLADNWKRYLASRLRRFVKGDVLEVGAGLGANVPYLYCDVVARWVSLEPDARLCDEYRRRQADGQIPAHCELVQGTVATPPPKETFDSILYIDVLEHIQDDKDEFERAYGRLRSGGHLVVVCPSHDFLFSPFDTAIGHFRRYDKRMYRELYDRRPLTMEYLDSIGMFASVANKLLLKQSYPNERQIKLWDRLLVPLSRIADPLTFRLIGKTILGVWRN